MRVATWNVNSLKQRLPRLLPWLDERQPDVVCLQETKLADDALAALLGDQLRERGYEIAANGMVGNWSSAHLVSCIASTSTSARCSQSVTRSTRARIEFTFHVATRTSAYASDGLAGRVRSRSARLACATVDFAARRLSRSRRPRPRSIR